MGNKTITIAEQAESMKTMAMLSAAASKGKDIKCFADLPPDVQDRINRMKVGETIKSMETVSAIKYEQFIIRGKAKKDEDPPSSGVGYSH